MHNGNWFAVSRMVFDHYVVGAGQSVKPADPQRGAYSRMEAWLWLVANAAYEQQKVINKGREVLINPGQLMAAHDYLAKAWNWTPDTVRYFVKRLELTLMISRWCDTQKAKRNTNQIQIVSICNYDRYQIAQPDNSQAISQPQPQAVSQARTKPAPSAHHESNNKQLTREKEIAADDADASPVTVNGAAIYGPNFKLEFKAIDMAAGLVGMDKQRARAIAEICARDWAANDIKPHRPMAMVKNAIMSDFNQGQVQDVRLAKAGGKQRAAETPAEMQERITRILATQEGRQ